MASAFSHAFVAIAAGKAYAREPRPRGFWILSVALSILPDLDVIGFAFGIRYEDFLGHRGFTHSIAFAMVAGALGLPLAGPPSWRLWLYLSAVTASHGVLDAMTDGGLGVAFFSPFDRTRYFLPFQPVRVSPIGIAPFFSLWGLEVLGTEIVYLWVPAALAAWAVRRRRRASPPAGSP